MPSVQRLLRDHDPREAQDHPPDGRGPDLWRNAADRESGRIAGQFAKPRSSPVERVGDLELPLPRGHIIHDDVATPQAADPDRMVQAYHQSAATLNSRVFTKGGFADITRVHTWNQEFVASSQEGQRYEALASEIERALRFMAACGIDLASERQLHEVDVYTSHEGLLPRLRRGPDA